MVLKKDAIFTLLKSIEGTTKAAGLDIADASKSGEKGEIPFTEIDGKDVIILTGDNGSAKIEIKDSVLTVLCNKSGEEAKPVSQTLFEYEAEDWAAKHTKSVANEVAESISKFFGTEMVYTTADDSKAKSDKKESTEKLDKVPEKKKKNNKKDSVVTYEPINLATRIENIYPELKGLADENTEKYETFLPEEYFENYANKYIIDTIKSGDRQTMKKIFNAFNIFYDEGSKDVQSLVAVSILSVNFAKEDGLFEKSKEFMDDTLEDAVENIVIYLKHAGGKRELKKFADPQPYKPKLFGKKK